MTTLEKAEALARHAHNRQYRRDKVTPYITHPERVVTRLVAQGHTDEDLLAAAWLHDTVEDGVLIWQTLRDKEIPEKVIDTVVALTKRLGEPYQQYLNRVKANPVARVVKVADILDNLSDTPTDKQILKYASALLYLLA